MAFQFAFRRVQQTILHDPENGLYGDCSRACLAMALGIPIDDVPHFADPTLYPDDVWDKAQRDWLARLGYGLVQLPFPGNFTVEQVVEAISNGAPSSPTILGGASPRGPWNHDVVVHRGVIVDPHPDQTGIIGGCIPDDPEHGSWYWVTIISSLT